MKRLSRKPSTTRHVSARPVRASSGNGSPSIIRTIPALERALETTSAPSLSVEIGGRALALTNLQKPFWRKLGLQKRHLLSYYLTVRSYILPHLLNRAMVMKRYPNGADGEFFFMKRLPSPHPEWLQTCEIEHRSGNVINFPVIDDPLSLLWIVNLGCIDLNQWYATCDDVDCPDYLHFDLDPVPGAGFTQVRAAAQLVISGLRALGMSPLIKTSGSKGIHIYVPIRRTVRQKEVWAFAKEFAFVLAEANPKQLTAEYRIAKRPRGRVLVDYNQNAWGRTLASVYSVRPRPNATVSTPITEEELDAGVAIEDFTIRNVPDRLRQVGDIWKPLLRKSGRFALPPLSRH